MKVLIAYDGSDGSRLAVECAARLPWPAGTRMRLVRVLPAVELWPIAGVATADAPAGPPLRDLEAVAQTLRRPGVDVDARATGGDDPAGGIIAEAEILGADMIMVGHRGHGPLATIVLGSVARDVVERAHRPVYVVRRATARNILFATDGSEGAHAALEFLAAAAIFRGAPLRVVSVVNVMQPVMSGVAPTMWDQARAVQRQLESETYRAHERFADEATRDLGVTGAPVSADVRRGEPAEQIVLAARASAADVIVMGTRGRGQLARAVLGSVAREVLLTADCSVLVIPSA